MRRSLKWCAAFLLMLLLPVQVTAAACAQVCFESQAEHAAQEAMHEAADGAAQGHCHEHGGGVPGEGKCCYAHTFMMESSAVPRIVPVASFEPIAFIARWTSFIPEEPSPPPIASLRAA